MAQTLEVPTSSRRFFTDHKELQNGGTDVPQKLPQLPWAVILSLVTTFYFAEHGISDLFCLTGEAFWRKRGAPLWHGQYR